LKYPPFPWAQNFQDGAHQTTGAQRKIFEKGTIFFGHPVHKFLERTHIQKKSHESEISGKKFTGTVIEQL
jgi:hypothetical protein